MSKNLKCMQQVTEIAGIAVNRLDQSIGFAMRMLRCSIAIVIIAGGAACDHQGTDRDASGDRVRILKARLAW